MRGRKPLPDQVKLLKGTWEKPRNPPAAPVVIGPLEPIGDPPDYLSDPEKECWRELVALAVPGVLKRADAVLLETMARLWAELRTPGEVMGHARIRLLLMGLSSMGLDPASRARMGVAAPTPRAPSPWDELKAAVERPVAQFIALQGGQRGGDD